MTKICSKCKQELPIEEFRWRNKAQGVKHSQCKDCEKKRDKIYYQASKNRREAVTKTAHNQKIRNIAIVDEYRQCGCKKCGEKRIYVLDFHHRNPADKICEIAHLIKSAGAAMLENELLKCDVLCANCHREFHYLQQELSISYEDYLSGNF